MTTGFQGFASLKRWTNELIAHVVIFALLVVPFFYAFKMPVSTPLEAAGIYNASNLLGHFDKSNNPIYTIADSYNAPDSDTLSGDGAIALDTTNHRLFVADASNKRVLVFNLNGSNTLDDQIADHVLGQSTFKTSSGGTTQNGFDNPLGLAYDNNRLFVSDTNNNRIMVFDVTSITDGENAVNVLGQEDFVSNGSATTQDGLSSPAFILLDPATNRLFVADSSNHRLMVFNVASITDGEDAVNVLGQADFVTGIGGTTQSSLSFPSGVAYDSAGTRLFVADANNRVMVFNVASITDGENAVNVLGVPDFTSTGSGTSQSTVLSPQGMTYDAAGSRLFVATSDSHRVMVFNVASITDGENAVNVLGQTDFVTDTSDVTQSKFSGPDGLLYDSGNSRLYVKDSNNNRIMVFDVTAITNGENAVDLLGQTDDSGNDLYTSAEQNDTPNNEGFGSPQGIALDAINHRLFVVDSGGHRILVFNLDSNNTFSGTDRLADYVLGQTTFKGNDSGTTQSTLTGPTGLTFDSSNQRLFVSDTDNNRVMVFDVTSITNGENAINVLGATDFVTNSGGLTSQNEFTAPGSLAYDTTGSRLFVVDTGNGRVMVFNVASITDGENAVNVLGHTDFVTSGGGLTQNELTPQNGGSAGLVYDAATNRLFVGDYGNWRVMVFNVASITDGENAVNVLGAPDFVSKVGGSTINTMNETSGLAYDSLASRLFVTDVANNRVMVFDVASIADGEDAVNVLGQADFTGNSNGLSQADVSSPRNSVYDTTSNQLFLVDSNNNRALLFDFVRITATSLPGGTTGAAYSQGISTTNSQGTVTSTVVSGALPTGLNLAGGTVSGTPTVAGNYNFTIRATDTLSTGTFFDDQAYSVTIAAGGGGGGGNPPVTSATVAINNSNLTTNDRNVTLSFSVQNANPNGALLHVSNYADFSIFATRSYADLMSWDLCQDLASCEPASRVVFVKIFLTSPVTTLTISDDILLQAQASSTPTPTATPMPTATVTPTVSPSPSISASPTPSPIHTPTPTPSGTPVVTPARTPTPTPISSASPSPTASVEPSTSVSPTPVTTPVLVPTPGPDDENGDSGTIFGPEGPLQFVESVSDTILSILPIRALIETEPLRIPAAIRDQARDVIERIPGAEATVVAAVTAANTVIIGTVLSLMGGFIHSFIGLLEFLQYLFVSFVSLLLVRNRPKPWGVVYDSVTKRAVPFAKVQLLDEQGRVLETRVTDQDGRYGFLAGSKSSGNARLMVRLQVSKHGYIFPSKAGQDTAQAPTYGPAYYGDLTSITPEEVVKFSIPVDPENVPMLAAKPGSRWNFGNLVTRFSNIGFYLALVSVPLQYLAFPTTLNLIMVGIVLGAVVLRSVGIWARPFGVVIDSLSRIRLPFALITLTDRDGQRVGFTVSDQEGRYILPSPKGNHVLEAFTPAHITPSRNSRTQLKSKGWVTSKVSV